MRDSSFYACFEQKMMRDNHFEKYLSFGISQIIRKLAKNDETMRPKKIFLIGGSEEIGTEIGGLLVNYDVLNEFPTGILFVSKQAQVCCDLVFKPYRLHFILLLGLFYCIWCNYSGKIFINKYFCLNL